MQGIFRDELQSLREEKEGIVFYRIEDPATTNVSRLYEIEYLIAKKLDGKHEAQDIIQDIKSECGFDLTEEDLNKFVNQLQNMGLLKEQEASAIPSTDMTPVTETHNHQSKTDSVEEDIVLPTLISIEKQIVMKRSNKHIVYIVASMVCIIAAVIAYFLYKQYSNHHQQKNKILHVYAENIKNINTVIYFPGHATKLEPRASAWFSFKKSGIIGEHLPKVGDKVKQGDIIAYTNTLQHKDVLAHLQQKIKQAQIAQEQTQSILQQYTEQQNILITEKEAMQKRIKTLHIKRDAAKIQQKIQHQKSLIRNTDEHIKIAKKNNHRAILALDALLEKQQQFNAHMIIAPMDGEITDVLIKPLQAISANAPVIHIRDTSVLKIQFEVSNLHHLKQGTAIELNIHKKNTTNANLVNIQQLNGLFQLEVELQNPNGVFSYMPASAIRLVQDNITNMFLTKPDYFILSNEGSHDTYPKHGYILIVKNNKAFKYNIDFIETRTDGIVLRDINNELNEHTQIITALANGKSLTTINHHTPIAIIDDHQSHPNQ